MLKTLALTVAIGLGLWVQSIPAQAETLRTITVAGGCFWCVEADFEKVRGVKEAVSGFAGGTTANPTYQQVTRGGTGHLEAVQITYDADIVSERQLYDLFFRSIDPTDAGGQFCDRGHSYTTGIFGGGQVAEQAKAAAQSALGQTIVTSILPAATFYPAGSYHQDYYKQTTTVLTRRGPKSKADAYKFYRRSCGRDARVRQLWGDAAPFAG